MLCLSKKYKSVASVNEKLACFSTDICNILNATKTVLEKGKNLKRKREIEFSVMYFQAFALILYASSFALSRIHKQSNCLLYERITWV